MDARLTIETPPPPVALWGLSPPSSEGSPWFLPWSEPDRTLWQLMHKRYYGSNIGRFMRPDPAMESAKAGYPQSWNRYAYVMNNPLRYIDPTGEEWYDLAGTGDWEWYDVSEMPVYTVNGATGEMTEETVQGVAELTVFSGEEMTLYSQSGEITAYPAVSGREGYGPETALTAVDNGPIPEGEYSFDPNQIQYWDDLSTWDQLKSNLGGGPWPGGTEAWGEARAWLKPAPGTNTGDRDPYSFTIHGGDYPGSAGCIDMTDSANQFFHDVSRDVGRIPVFIDYSNWKP